MKLSYSPDELHLPINAKEPEGLKKLPVVDPYSLNPKFGWIQLVQKFVTASYIKDGDTVLDLGCGHAEILRVLEYNGPKIKRYVGIDGVIEKNLNPEIPATFKKRDLADGIDMEDGSVDFCICESVFEHLPKDHNLLNEVHRVLKADGICTFNPMVANERSGRTDLRIGHVWMYTLDEIYKKLDGLFKIEEQYFQGFPTQDVEKFMLEKFKDTDYPRLAKVFPFTILKSMYDWFSDKDNAIHVYMKLRKI